jgi:hypothetical protein
MENYVLSCYDEQTLETIYYLKPVALLQANTCLDVEKG